MQFFYGDSRAGIATMATLYGTDEQREISFWAIDQAINQNLFLPLTG